MNILVIEDNQLKREKICDYLTANFDVSLSEAASYNSGLNAVLAGRYDLLVLDMSMPTFDRTLATNGGRFRALGGKEIAVRLQKLKRLIPFVVVTGYSDFSVNAESLSISQIDEALKKLGDEYKGCVFFDAVESVWKEHLLEIVRGIA
jgi:CheY-like chemotaxis protein